MHVQPLSSLLMHVQPLSSLFRSAAATVLLRLAVPQRVGETFQTVNDTPTPRKAQRAHFFDVLHRSSHRCLQTLRGDRSSPRSHLLSHLSSYHLIAIWHRAQLPLHHNNASQRAVDDSATSSAAELLAAPIVTTGASNFARYVEVARRRHEQFLSRREEEEKETDSVELDALGTARDAVNYVNGRLIE